MRAAIVAGLVVFVFSTAALGAANPYVLSDLGAFSGGGASAACAINNAGQIVGWAELKINSSYYRRPFLYSNGTMTNLGYVGGNQFVNGCAYGISPDGKVVGQSGTGAFLYALSMQDIGLQVGSDSVAYGVNSAGQVVGEYTSGDGAERAFLYNANGDTVSDLGINPAVYPDSCANGINAAGLVVGKMGDNGAKQFAFSYSGGTLAQLKCLGPAPSDPPMYSDEAFAVNNAGHIVGWSMSAESWAWEPFLHDGTKATGLGNLFGYDSAVVAVNLSDQAVGYTDTEFGNHAMLYLGGRLLDMSSRINPETGWFLQYATGINDAGWIVGSGLLHGIQRAFLARPAISGDANLDGKIDINDLNLLLANYGRAGMLWGDGDFNGDNIVDINDLNAVLANYDRSLAGAAATVAAVPEPTALALMAALVPAAALMNGRRKCAARRQ